MLYKNEQYLKEAVKTKTNSQIAKENNISADTVAYWLRKYNIKKYEETAPYMNKAYMIKLYNKYKSGNKISKLLNCNEKTIYAWLEKHGIDTSETGSQGARKHFYNENYFKKIDTERKAYFLGFILADGCVYLGANKNSYRFQMNLQIQDKYILEELQKDIGSDYKIQDKQFGYKKNGNPKFISLLKINSSKLCEDLINLGVIPRKSMKQKMEEKLIPNNLIKHFIRGYFDGNGSCSIRKNLISLDFFGSKIICLQIDKYLKLNNINKNVLYGNKKNELYGLRINNTDNKILLYYYLYEDATIYLKRKKEKFDKFLQYKKSPLIK